jgi:predicted transposase/invertase (TIGR01784 family)
MLAELMPGIQPDWEFTYNAPVIKEREFRLDGVFTPLSENPRVPLVFAEAQMQSDSGFYWRYFAEIFLYLEQYKISRTWQGLLILVDREQRLGPELPYQELLDQRVTRLYLSDLQDRQGLSANLALLQLLVVDQKHGAEIAKGLLRQAETEEEFQRRLGLIETILANKFPELTEDIIMQILDLKKMDITQSRFYQEIIQEGRQQALQEGRQQGLQEEAFALVFRLLIRRCGNLSPTLEERVKALSLEQLEALGEALLDFTGVSDLDVWLANL